MVDNTAANHSVITPIPIPVLYKKSNPKRPKDVSMSEMQAAGISRIMETSPSYPQSLSPHCDLPPENTGKECQGFQGGRFDVELSFRVVHERRAPGRRC